MSGANGLTFDGFDLQGQPGAVMFKGPFSGKYPLSVDTGAFKVNHGQWVKCQRGPRAGQAGVVAGTLDGALWLYFLGEGVAMPMKGANNAAQLATVFDLASCTPSASTSTKARGPLGNDYILDVTTLLDKYGLRKDEKFSLHGGTSNVSAVGELFGCLWVKQTSGIESRQQEVVPLQGATSEAALHELYSIGEPCDPSIGTTTNYGGVASRASTPRRTLVTTPRNAKPAFTLDSAKQVATCQASFGNTLILDTSRKALSQWGVNHGQSFQGIGMNVGKRVVIVGAHAGALYIHVDGDKRVTCCRNCENGDELAENYGFGNGSTPRKGTAADNKNSVSPAAAVAKKAPLTDHTHRRSAPAATEAPATASPVRASHRKIGFSMWTSFGRQEFDISMSGTLPFGYSHGTTVKATQGVDKDSTFHVVGENGGVLWVVQEGKPRAVALRHCQNKGDIQERYGFMPAGKKDLSYLSHLEQEPAFTPINTPRGANALSPMTPRSTATAALGGMETPRGLTSTCSYASAPTPNNTPAGMGSVPALNFGALQPSSPPMADMRALSSPGSNSSHQQQQLPATSSCHRNYLKAVALLKTGAHSTEEDKLRFHKYYMTHTADRLNHAMSKINLFRDVYGSSEFERASCNEMLNTMRTRAELFV